MKTKLTLIIFLLVNASLSFSQNEISGKVKEQSEEALTFANIVLYQLDNKKILTGTISDVRGLYKFKNVSNGSYWLEVSVLGFETKKSEPFILSEDNNQIELNFTLKEENQLLNEVVIKFKRPTIKQTAEKLIVDLEKSEMVNTSLQDVMRKVPGVLVTDNGISVAGNNGVKILINGKTTEYMDVETLLRDFPADNISKIEVIEQPGAEYEASGSAAIINIILKKNIQLGTHGSTNLWVGEDEGFEYGTGFSIASYKNKLNWQTNVNYSQPTWRNDLFLNRTVANETYNQETIEPFNPTKFNIGGNIDYYINDKHSFGVGVQISSNTADRITSSKTIIADAITTNTLFSENNFDENRKNFNINPYYEYKTETDKLVIDFNYVNYENDSANILSEAAGSSISFDDRKYIQNGKYTIKTYKVDYIKIFSDNLKVSAGTRYANVATDNDLQSFNNTNGTFDFDEDTSSQFLIDESIFALYSKLNGTSGKWSFSGGLRYENSNTNGTSFFVENGGEKIATKNSHIKRVFSSASVSRELSEVLSAGLSYSYRIQRPSYNSLNSFETYLDPYSASEGNPNLTPAYTNNYQFNLTYEGQPFFTIGYSKTEDVIFDLITQDNETAQIRQQDVNLEYNTNWNFRLFAPLNFTQKLEGYTGVIVTNTDYQSSIYGIDLNKWNLIWFVQASYQLPWNINFESSGNYGTGALEDQIVLDWFAGLDFSFGKFFLDDKLKVNLGFNKMLNRGYVGTIDYGNGTADVNSNGSRQNVQLKMVYSFGSKFGKRKTSRNSNNEEENRIGDEN